MTDSAAHHDHDHHSEAGSANASVLRASAFLRLAGVILILIPLWIAVYWAIAS